MNALDKTGKNSKGGRRKKEVSEKKDTQVGTAQFPPRDCRGWHALPI